KDNLRLTADWTRGRFSGLLRGSRYGEFCSIEDLPAADAVAQVFGAKWVADLELAYNLKKVTLGAGVQNAFNALPDRQIEGVAFNNIRTFPRNATPAICRSGRALN